MLFSDVRKFSAASFFLADKANFLGGQLVNDLKQVPRVTGKARITLNLNHKALINSLQHNSRTKIREFYICRPNYKNEKSNFFQPRQIFSPLDFCLLYLYKWYVLYLNLMYLWRIIAEIYYFIKHLKAVIKHHNSTRYIINWFSDSYKYI